jgi:hypothetical protein
MMSKIHVIPDENLGGVLREYAEVPDRKADVGDYVIRNDIIRKVTGRSDICEGVEFEPYLNEGEVDETIGWADGYYKTLEPTDIVHIDGKKFRMVERKVKVGEKVIVTETHPTLVYTELGEIVEIIEEDGLTGGIIKPHAVGEKGALYHFQYRVLKPLYTCDRCGKALGEVACSNSTGGSYCSAKCADADEPQAEVDERDASPKVIDMLANLAQRITELERYADITRDKYELINDRLSELERKLNHIQDEIDTLHANQRKLAEDTTNRLDRHSERIRELAEMIGERSDKVFNFPIKPFKFSDLNGKTLRIYSAHDITDKLTTTVTVGIDINDGNMYVLEVNRK